MCIRDRIISLNAEGQVVILPSNSGIIICINKSDEFIPIDEFNHFFLDLLEERSCKIGILREVKIFVEFSIKSLFLIWDEENEVVVIISLISSFLKMSINFFWIIWSFSVEIKNVLGDSPHFLNCKLSFSFTSISLAKKSDL